MVSVVAFVNCSLLVRQRDIASKKNKAVEEVERGKGQFQKPKRSMRGLRGRGGGEGA